MVKDVFSIKGTGTFSQHLPRGAVPLAARLWGHVFLQAPGTTGILARAQLWIVWASWHRGWGRGHRGLRPVSCPSGPGVECVHLSSWPPSPPVDELGVVPVCHEGNQPSFPSCVQACLQAVPTSSPAVPVRASGGCPVAWPVGQQRAGFPPVFHCCMWSIIWGSPAFFLLTTLKSSSGHSCDLAGEAIPPATPAPVLALG